MTLTNDESAALSYLVAGAMAELDLSQERLLDLVSAASLPLESKSLWRVLNKNVRTRCTTAMRVLDALIIEARKRGEVLYRGNPRGLRLWKLEKSGALFRPAHCSGASIAWDDLRQCVETHTFCSALYHFRATIEDRIPSLAASDTIANLRHDIRVANEAWSARVADDLSTRRSANVA